MTAPWTHGGSATSADVVHESHRSHASPKQCTGYTTYMDGSLDRSIFVRSAYVTYHWGQWGEEHCPIRLFQPLRATRPRSYSVGLQSERFILVWFREIHRHPKMVCVVAPTRQKASPALSGVQAQLTEGPRQDVRNKGSVLTLSSPLSVVGNVFNMVLSPPLAAGDTRCFTDDRCTPGATSL